MQYEEPTGVRVAGYYELTSPDLEFFGFGHNHKNGLTEPRPLDEKTYNMMMERVPLLRVIPIRFYIISNGFVDINNLIAP